MDSGTVAISSGILSNLCVHESVKHFTDSCDLVSNSVSNNKGEINPHELYQLALEILS
jgi:hypothetical protein